MEDGIVYRNIRDPCVLTGAPALDRHRRALRSYFECSSVDGRPTIIDRLRVQWLLLTRNVIIDGNTLPPLWRRGTKKIITIGMSGFIVAAAVALIAWYLSK